MQKRSYTQDAAMPAGRNSSDIGVIMKPEGSMKICVLNGSRQVDKVVQERLSAFPCRTSATR